MEIRDRKRVIFFVRIGLILATIVFVVSWIGGRVMEKVRESNVDGITITTAGPTPTALAKGDIQIISTDGNFDVTLQGNQILAGLSPKMIEKVKADVAKETSNNDKGLGAVIANAVKSGVASAIGIHVSFDLASVKEVRYEDGKLTIVDKDGDTHGLAGDSKDGNTKEKAVFSKEDADKFIEAVNARKKELGIP